MPTLAAPTLPAWLSQTAPPETASRILSPSRLTAAAEPPVISPFGEGRKERLRRGSLIHLLFEILPELAADDAPRRRRGLPQSPARPQRPTSAAKC